MIGNDGNPLVEVDGVDAQFCTTRRQLLTRIGDELNFWGRTWRQRHGAPVVQVASEDAEDEDEGADVYEEDEDEQEALEDAHDEATA